MFCSKCGKQIHDSASFCEYCGAQVMRAQPAPQPAPQGQTAQTQPTPVYQPQPAYQSQPVYQTQPTQQPAPKQEDTVKGILGALIGAAIGCVAIILFSQMGIVASAAGIILAICTLKGYEMMGGGMSKKGLILCIIIILVAPYIADTADWALVIMRDYDAGLSFGEAFGMVGELLENGAIDEDLYYENLGMIYLFTAIGAVATVWSAAQQLKKNGQ